MSRTGIAALILVAALAWAGWEIHSLRQENAELTAANINSPVRHSPGVATATTASGARASGAKSATAAGNESTTKPGKLSGIDSLILMDPKIQTDGSIVIWKGTTREIVVTPEEAAQLATGLARASADKQNSGPDGASYSAGKATGAPNGPNHGGDSSDAWCPKPSNGSNEWLQLKYARNVEISEVNIHETYATGALAKVTAVMPDGSERTLWEGTEPVETPPVERVLKVPPGIRADQLRITMDGTRINNWQEIDAVEIVGKDGIRQWATEATASSHWGSGGGWSGDFGVEAPQWSHRKL